MFNHLTATVQDIDTKISEDRTLYLAAYWRGHDGEAEFYVLEIARLQRLRLQRDEPQQAPPGPG